jgi:hypothetical protein
VQHIDWSNEAMQWVGAAIMIGLLALLLIGGALLARSEKTPNSRSGSPYEDFYRSKGLGNVLEANEKLNQFSAGKRQQPQHQGQQQHKHKAE